MENRRRRALREILCRQRRRYWGCGARHRNWLGGWDRCRACVSTGRSPFYLIGDGGATQPLPRFACQTTIAVQSVRRKPCGLQIVKPAYSCLKFKKLKHTRLALDYCANNSSPPDFYGNSTPLTTVDSRKVSVLSAAKRLPVNGWFLVGRVPAGEALAPVETMQMHLLLATVVFTVAAGFLIWLVTWRLLKGQFAPMVDAAKTVDALAHSSGSIQPLPVKIQDEVGDLIGAFNRLLTVLDQRQESLRASEKSLHQAQAAGHVGSYAFDLANDCGGSGSLDSHRGGIS